MRLLETGIILTQARQITIMVHDYNASSSNQAEKGISYIRQINIFIAYILVYTDIIIK